ncbi:MAG: hypothetical protein AAGU19_08650 [Prolixibacteraceae bacterium]
MKLQDLKSAWNQYSSTDASRHQLKEAELHHLLRKRTLGLIDRIDRNIRIGFVAFLILSVLFILDDFILSPLLSEGNRIPFWIIIIDGLSITLILSTFFYFYLNYTRAKNSYSQSDDLRRVLNSLINILNTYRRSFHWALGVLLFVLCIAFFSGLLMGVETAAFRQKVAIAELDQSQLIAQIAQGMVILIVLIGILFLFFQWGFRKLYGRYITQLEETLKELEEGE